MMIMKRRIDILELHERIRFLRKDTLKMSMDAFGKQLGVSRDTIVLHAQSKNFHYSN